MPRTLTTAKASHLPFQICSKVACWTRMQQVTFCFVELLLYWLHWFMMVLIYRDNLLLSELGLCNFQISWWSLVGQNQRKMVILFRYKSFQYILSNKDTNRKKIICFSGLILSGGATILFSTGSSLTVFAALWFVNGFAQGAGWPACAKLLKRVLQPAA